MSRKNNKLEEPDWLFPFLGMAVGDSFFIPTLKTEELAFAIENSAKEFGIKVRVKPMVDAGFLGVRTWRIE